MATEAQARALPPDLQYIQYNSSLESQYLPSIRALISKDLSEPYSIYVYRYFLYQWGDLCFMVNTFLLIIRPCTIANFRLGHPCKIIRSDRRRYQ